MGTISNNTQVLYIYIYTHVYVYIYIYMYKYRYYKGLASISGSSVSLFLFIIERDEIRRSINKTNIHAFLKHYYYKYWLTP